MTFHGQELSVVKIQLSGREQKGEKHGNLYSAIDANLEQWSQRGWETCTLMWATEWALECVYMWVLCIGMILWEFTNHLSLFHINSHFHSSPFSNRNDYISTAYRLFLYWPRLLFLLSTVSSFPFCLISTFPLENQKSANWNKWTGEHIRVDCIFSVRILTECLLGECCRTSLYWRACLMY